MLSHIYLNGYYVSVMIALQDDLQNDKHMPLGGEYLNLIFDICITVQIKKKIKTLFSDSIKFQSKKKTSPSLLIFGFVKASFSAGCL